MYYFSNDAMREVYIRQEYVPETDSVQVEVFRAPSGLSRGAQELVVKSVLSRWATRDREQSQARMLTRNPRLVAPQAR